MSDFKIVSLLNPPVVFATGVITASAGTQSLSSGSLVFSNSNGVTFGMNGGTITASVAGGGGGGAALSAGTNSTNAGTVSFLNSNGVSFGMNTNGAITATVATNYLTTARASTDAIGLNTAQSNVTWTVNSSGLSLDARGYAGTATGATNASITANSNGISVSVAAPVTTNGLISAINVSAGTTSNNLTKVTFSDSNGVSFGLNGSVVTATVATNYLTSQSNQAFSASGGSSAFQTLGFSNANGFTFSNSNGSVVGSYTVPTVTAGSDTLGISNLGNTAGTSGVVSGDQVQVLFAGGNNITLSQSIKGASATITISGAHAGGAQTGISGISAGTTIATSGTVSFADSNGVSWGLNGQTITATVRTNYLTTARASNDAIGLATAQSNVTWTANSAGLSLDARGYAGTVTGATNASVTANSGGISVSVAAPVTTNGLISAINMSAGTTSNNLTKLTFSDSNGISFGLNGSVITATVKTNYLTTAMASDRGSDFVQATAAFNGTNISGTIASNAISLSVAAPGAAAENNWINLLGANTAGNTTASGSTIGWSAGNGLTLSGTNGSQVVLSVGPYITTARASTDAVGLNTAQSNVTWTVNSSGISLDGRGYAGTATGATNASLTVNSNGVSISVAAPGGGGGGGIGAGVSTFGNTAGSTGTVTTGNVVFVGSNGISLSQSTGAAGSDATITINGHTHGVLSYWANNMGDNRFEIAGTAAGNSLVSIRKLLIPEPVAFSAARFGFSLSVGTATNNSSAFFNYSNSAVLYSRNGSTLSSILSGSATGTVTWSSNATASILGANHITLPWNASTLLPPGEYWLAHHLSTNNTATGGAATTALGNTVSVFGNYPAASANANIRPLGQATNNTYGMVHGQGIISTGATRDSIAFSTITNVGSRGVLGAIVVELQNYTV